MVVLRQMVAARSARRVAVAVTMIGTVLVAIPASNGLAGDAPRSAPAQAVDADHTTCSSSLIDGSVYFVCDLLSSGSSIDLTSLPGVTPGADTPIWIQAFGGAGGTTNLAGKTGDGGDAGFAQVITTLSDYQTKFGTTDLHYFLGSYGGSATNNNSWKAGNGGAATLVSSVDPSTTALSTTNLVAVAGGGGGAVTTCKPSSCRGGLPIYGDVRGGDGGIVMSNQGGQNKSAKNGGGEWGGRNGDDGTGGQHVHAVGGEVGNDGADGIGGHGGGRGGPKLWLNDADLSSALGNAGAGGAPPCMQYDNEAFCVSGGGGGGWGGGASGSSPHGQYRRAGGGGGDSFAMSSATADTNAPITPPTAPSNGNGTVTVTVEVDLDFQSTFCKQTTLAGTEGFRCVVPFNWEFEIPTAYTGQNWLVTVQAVGGRGGNGGRGGRAQTTLLTTGLSGKTLYAWVGAQGAESVAHGGGGGGASALGTSPDPWSGTSGWSSGSVLSPDLLLVAGGGGGGTGLNKCNDGGGAGGVAVTAAGVAYGSGSAGGGAGHGGSGKYTDGLWQGGWDGSSAGNTGTGGPSYLTFVGGLGGSQSGIGAGTITSLAAPDTPDSTSGGPTIEPAGSGGSGFCKGGGGGGGAAGGGGGAGGAGSVESPQDGGGGGGGGSQAAASNVPSNQLPSWGGQWLTTADQTSGQVSLFFYKGSQGPPPVPADGETIDDVQPTLGLDANHSGSFAYRVTDTTAGTTYLASPSTQNALWTIPQGGALMPGHTYSWEIVDGNSVVQAARTFTVSNSTQPASPGVRMEMRSMNHYADSNSPEYLQPESGQKVPGLSSSFSVPSGCTGGDKPGCYEYKGSAGNPDSYSQYFTTATAVQATTNPGAINIDWDHFDPFGLGLRELFTLHTTGILTVPVSGSYTFAVNAFGGARFTLTDPSGATLGGDPMIDTWGQVGNCSSSFQAETSNTDSWESEAEALAAVGCVNSHGTTTASSAVSLTADVAYTFVMDGFMSWQPGPFQLLYASNLFASDLAAVPGAWFTTTQPALGAEPEPECAGLPATIIGTDRGDWLFGTPGDDVIVAGRGNDIVLAGGGHDVVCAEGGNDIVLGQDGDDLIYGGNGHDWILGGGGADRIEGGDGRDRISGGSGDDTIEGGFGSDRLFGGWGDDVLAGLTLRHWLADPGSYRNADHAHGGGGSDRCLHIQPHRARSCESDEH